MATDLDHLIDGEVFAPVAPGLSDFVKVIDAFEYEGRAYVIIVKRSEPGPPILDVLEPGQFTIPDRSDRGCPC